MVWFRADMIALRWLIAGEWRAHPARIVLAALAIAVGVALGFAVHLINGSALSAFSRAVQSVNGAADLQVRSTTPLGVDENLYAKVATVEGVADASPVVILYARHGKTSFTLLGLDIIRAANVTPSLIGQRSSGPDQSGDAVFGQDALFLSRGALEETRKAVGDTVEIAANGRIARLRIAGILPSIEDGRKIGVIDIAAAQWRFARLSRIDRIDLKLADDARVRDRIAAILPRDATLASADSEVQQGDALSRAYRVNLDMLALVALLTGAFLVYSAQSLSVTRRMRSFALMRTLGMSKAGVIGQVAIEGAIVGVIGAAAGLALGYALAAIALRFLGGDLGAGYFGDAAPVLTFAPAAALLFFALGIAAALAGSLIPARAAANAHPAVALKNAGDAVDLRTPAPWRIAALLIGLGTITALLPAVGRLPLFGYLAMALLLAGGTAAMPWLARTLLTPFDRLSIKSPAAELAIRHLRGAPGQAGVALSGIVASTSLMIAMAVMVTSFRGAVDDWLGEVLTADLYLRVEGGAGFDPEAQARLRETPGVAKIAFTRQIPLRLEEGQPPMILIARPMDGDMPLLDRAVPAPAGTIPVYLSEPASRILDLRPGYPLTLPLGRDERFMVAGIWRDYSRQQGAMILGDRDFDRLTGDRTRTEAGITLDPGSKPSIVGKALIARSPPAIRSQVATAQPALLRRFALSLFDRSFAITYLLEAVAILVGLAGVAATISAQTIARSREFGMLRHIGVAKRQIVAMLSVEGALLGAIGGIAGILLGLTMSQVLIHVVNPQSFNWTMTTRLPFALIAAVMGALVAAAAGTAALASRRAVSIDAVRAVREDW